VWQRQTNSVLHELIEQQVSFVLPILSLSSLGEAQTLLQQNLRQLDIYSYMFSVAWDWEFSPAFSVLFVLQQFLSLKKFPFIYEMAVEYFHIYIFITW